MQSAVKASVGMKLRRFVVRHFVDILTFILVCASLSFLRGIVEMRGQVRVSNPDLFTDRQLVCIETIKDGDEVVIASAAGTKTVCRLLGIKSFSPTASDSLLSEYGRICFDYLRSRAEGKQALIRIPDKRTGGQGRLLGTLFLKDAEGEFTVDLGLDLVERGYSLVYTQFTFESMQNYLDVQHQATAEHAGFWSNERISSLARTKQVIWSEARERQDD